MLYINLAQVGNLQYKFYLDENIKTIVKPINKNNIEKILSLNDNSGIFAFLLDHEYTIESDVVAQCYDEKISKMHQQFHQYITNQKRLFSLLLIHII